MPTGADYDPNAAQKVFDDRIRQRSDRINQQIDDAQVMQAMQRLQALVESANAPETQAFQTDLSGMPPSPTPMRQPTGIEDRYDPSGQLPSLDVQSPQGPQPTRQPSAPPPTPKIPPNFKAQFPTGEWNSMVKRFPQIALASDKQEMMDALDGGKTILAIQAGQKIGLTPEHMIGIMGQHKVQRVMEKIDAQLQTAPDQESAQKIILRASRGLTLPQRQHLSSTYDDRIKTLDTKDMINTKKLGDHIGAFNLQIDDQTSDAVRKAWRKYMPTVEPELRAKFSEWAQKRVEDLQANERADRLEKGQRLIPSRERDFDEEATRRGLHGAERFAFKQNARAESAGLETGARAAAGKEATRQFDALPQAAQENLSGAIEAWRSLNVIEQSIGESGIVTGLISKGQATLGFNPKAIRFEASRNSFKLSAQAMIKGIPSNFDVQTLIDTIPSLTSAPETNQARVDNARAQIRNLAQNTVAYYKSAGYTIPTHIQQIIKQFGINEASVPPWNGLGDPLAPGTSPETASPPKVIGIRRLD